MGTVFAFSSLFDDGVPGVVGEDLRRLGGLKDLLEADLQQAVEHDVDVVQMLELPVEGRPSPGISPNPQR